MAKSMWDFFKEVGLEERPKGDLVSMVRLTLIGSDEDGYRHAEYSDFDVKTSGGRQDIATLVEWLKRPNWKAYASKSMNYAADEEELYVWTTESIHFPSWEDGYCDLEEYELTYYDNKGKPYVLGVI